MSYKSYPYLPNIKNKVIINKDQVSKNMNKKKLKI